MFFQKQYPYNSEQSLADNLQYGSVLTVGPVGYPYLKAPSNTQVYFINWDAETKKFMCSLDLKKPDSYFAIDFFDISLVRTPENDRILYKRGTERM